MEEPFSAIADELIQHLVTASEAAAFPAWLIESLEMDDLTADTFAATFDRSAYTKLADTEMAIEVIVRQLGHDWLARFQRDMQMRHLTPADRLAGQSLLDAGMGVQDGPPMAAFNVLQRSVGQQGARIS